MVEEELPQAMSDMAEDSHWGLHLGSCCTLITFTRWNQTTSDQPGGSNAEWLRRFAGSQNDSHCPVRRHESLSLCYLMWQLDFYMETVCHKNCYFLQGTVRRHKIEMWCAVYMCLLQTPCFLFLSRIGKIRLDGSWLTYHNTKRRVTFFSETQCRLKLTKLATFEHIPVFIIQLLYHIPTIF